jgi:circadian clock protein KaiB
MDPSPTVELIMSEYVFDLYIAGHTSRSMQAISNLEALCEDVFSGNYRLNVIDVLEQPKAAEEERIIATPTLIQRAPPPSRRIIGVFSDRESMLKVLGLRT